MTAEHYPERESERETAVWECDDEKWRRQSPFVGSDFYLHTIFKFLVQYYFWTLDTVIIIIIAISVLVLHTIIRRWWRLTSF